MLDTVILKSAQSASELIFSQPKPPSWRYPVSAFTATLRDKNSVTSAEVYLYSPEGLAAFFETLAGQPQDWNDEKQWISIEEHLSLNGIFDSSNCLELRVVLTPDPDQRNRNVQTVIHILAIELGAIATQIKQFLHLL
jgi:Family of unknown function (DUF6228)